MEVKGIRSPGTQRGTANRRKSNRETKLALLEDVFYVSLSKMMLDFSICTVILNSVSC